MLCQTCHNIFRNSCPHNNRISHHFYIHQLERAAFERCHICQEIWRGISDQPPTIAREAFEAPPEQGALITEPILTYDVQHRYYRSRDNSGNISELSFVVDKSGIGGCRRTFTFYLNPMRSMTVPLASIPWY